MLKWVVAVVTLAVGADVRGVLALIGLQQCHPNLVGSPHNSNRKPIYINPFDPVLANCFIIDSVMLSSVSALRACPKSHSALAS